MTIYPCPCPGIRWDAARAGRTGAKQGNKEMNDSPELMTMAAFCTRYSLGKTSAYRLARNGQLRLRKFGTATRIARADAEAWAASLPVREGEVA